ncbi:MAG: STAS domain-containing protein [Brevinematales bacterium]
MVSLEHRGAVSVLHISGNLDVSDSQLLEEMGKNLLQQGKISLVLDLKEVEYLHSSGARAFLVLLREVKSRQGLLILSGIQPNVQKTLEIIGLSGVFEMVNSVEEALNLFG